MQLPCQRTLSNFDSMPCLAGTRSDTVRNLTSEGPAALLCAQLSHDAGLCIICLSKEGICLVTLLLYISYRLKALTSQGVLGSLRGNNRK